VEVARNRLPSEEEEVVVEAAAWNLRSAEVVVETAGSLPLAAAAASPTSDDLLMPL
jgi:hypothetical protein